MAVDVNPPPQLRIPEAFRADPELRAWYEQQQVILFQLWNRTGGDNDLVADGARNHPKTQAQINAIQQQIGSGNALTWDDTGFSWDSTRLTFDRTEA